jgi:glutathione peroxidase
MKIHPIRSLAVLVPMLMSLAGHAMAPKPKVQPLAEADLGQAPADGKGVYAFEADDIDGKKRSLSEFKGKVMLIMNTASKCGTTPQYANLEALYKKDKDKGFVAVAFPSNDFGHQEPGTNADIKKFCVVEYGIDFPIFSKIVVLGQGQHPLYTYLTKQPGVEGDLKWNGVKFLVNRKGKVVARFDSWTNPDDPAVLAVIDQLLAQAQ